MDYEKAYKEAFERAKEIYNEHKAQCFDVMLKVFPELKESEDEKIRRCVSDVVRKYGVEFTTGTITKEKMLAWLESMMSISLLIKLNQNLRLGTLF